MYPTLRILAAILPVVACQRDAAPGQPRPSPTDRSPVAGAAEVERGLPTREPWGFSLHTPGLSARFDASGAAIAGWRRRRRREDEERIELAGRVESYGGELSRARIVHDAMFPPPFTGNISFEYEYQPIHEIGGDYVHVRACPHSGKVTSILIENGQPVEFGEPLVIIE